MSANYRDSYMNFSRWKGEIQRVLERYPDATRVDTGGRTPASAADLLRGALYGLKKHGWDPSLAERLPDDLVVRPREDHVLVGAQGATIEREAKEDNRPLIDLSDMGDELSFDDVACLCWLVNKGKLSSGDLRFALDREDDVRAAVSSGGFDVSWTKDEKGLRIV